MKHVVGAALALAGSFPVPLLGQQPGGGGRVQSAAAAPQLRFHLDENFDKVILDDAERSSR